MRILIYLTAFLLTAFNGKGFATDSTHHFLTGFQAHYGIIIPHSRSIRDISHTHPYGFEVSRSKLHTSAEKYRVFNAYWISGFETRYFSFQNPAILGGAFDLTAFAEPVLHFGPKSLFTVRGGAGFSYHTLIYDAVENPRNKFFSSRLSFPLYVDLRYKRKVGDKSLLTLSACYNHISNGGIKQPNKGMNFPTMAVGLEFYDKLFPRLEPGFLSHEKREKANSFFLLQSLISVKVLGGVNGVPEKTCFIYGFQARVAKPISPFYALHAGSEIIIDGYIKETLIREQVNEDYKRLAVIGGQDFFLGKMIFSQFLGVYIYSPYKPPDPVYQKYELSYRFGKGICLGVYVKAHLQVAELMGISVNKLIFFKER